MHSGVKVWVHHPHHHHRRWWVRGEVVLGRVVWVELWLEGVELFQLVVVVVVVEGLV